MKDAVAVDIGLPVSPAAPGDHIPDPAFVGKETEPGDVDEEMIRGVPVLPAADLRHDSPTPSPFVAVHVHVHQEVSPGPGMAAVQNHRRQEEGEDALAGLGFDPADNADLDHDGDNPTLGQLLVQQEEEDALPDFGLVPGLDDPGDLNGGDGGSNSDWQTFLRSKLVPANLFGALAFVLILWCTRGFYMYMFKTHAPELGTGTAPAPVLFPSPPRDSARTMTPGTGSSDAEGQWRSDTAEVAIDCFRYLLHEASTTCFGRNFRFDQGTDPSDAEGSDWRNALLCFHALLREAPQ